ncbi:hypothetical protein QQX98_009770 [Neonectria punicea]|uniref:Xylanolytic transcriptional activator regulatory domain-containing protein n=1 Tax=Neonectria punicea TaxID=979145 RepID=A0ABR1GRP4_9HYPO
MEETHQELSMLLSELDAPHPDVAEAGATSNLPKDYMPAGLATRARRKRTKRACARCRLRKCRECVFDQLVPQRLIGRPESSTESSKISEENTNYHLTEALLLDSPGCYLQDEPVNNTSDTTHPAQSSSTDSNSHDKLHSAMEHLFDADVGEPLTLDDFFSDGNSDQSQVEESDTLINTIAAPPLQSSLASTHIHPSRPMPFILFSCYRFIEPGLMHELPSEDAAFLEQRGCFHIPPRPALDEFVRHYFAHFHPILPLLNETAFWRMYSPQNRRTPPQTRMPLFVLQSMLFVSCPFVPAQILRNLGFATVQAARNAFYSRAKTLFDFNLHKDDISNAQGALMLTYYSPTTTNTVNTHWLISAIHFARSARADEYHIASFCAQERQILKRLWWCCIVRDRVMSLSLRRPLNIRPDDFDFTQPGLGENDFLNEFRGPNVYDISTKRLLVRIIASLCELAVVLNGVLTILYPMGKPSALVPKRSEKDVNSHLELLNMWYKKTKGMLQPSGRKHTNNESPVLFTKMIYIYYYTAKTSICHHMMLLSMTDYENPTEAEQRRLQSRSELEISLQGIADGLKELDSLGLIDYLPNTFVAFLAFPFTWNILEAKVLTTGGHSEDAQKNLTAYTSVMRRFRSLYESTESTLQSIEKTVTFIKANETFTLGFRNSHMVRPLFSETIKRPDPTQRSRDAWVDLLLGNPHTYLRIALTVDYSLTHGQCPSEDDIPRVLQSLDLNELLPDGDEMGEAISFAPDTFIFDAENFLTG